MAIDLAYGLGILGNVVSFLVYLAPVPTFYRIWKKRSTEEFQAVPYAVALFSAMLYLYYASLKGNSLVLITINSLGCLIETFYLVVFLIFSNSQSRIGITKVLLVFNVSCLGLIIGTTYLAAEGKRRVDAVGWICAAFSVTVFAAPLTIMRQVIKTKSVEFMPLSLSFFLTICAVVWFFYGFAVRDFYIAGPNILGFVFGVAQMGLYMVYRNNNNNVKNPKKQFSTAAAEAKVHDITIELNTTTPRRKQEEEEDNNIIINQYNHEQEQEDEDDDPEKQSSPSDHTKHDLDQIVVVDPSSQDLQLPALVLVQVNA
ncbi:bidirectional sugar transporter NEC1-like [Andrographis paniculata]|uniref:bidirectional sugar transporter NEC1-like n=1 Tax=Andrographis paniculata TaxID=175694 RepID=UPI0021E89DC6|nr:bidirectional sugar transporter NEC1-like [Andrographis paniculata]